VVVVGLLAQVLAQARAAREAAAQVLLVSLMVETEPLTPAGAVVVLATLQAAGQAALALSSSKSQIPTAHSFLLA
jgi:hypothetical protein